MSSAKQLSGDCLKTPLRFDICSEIQNAFQYLPYVNGAGPCRLVMDEAAKANNPRHVRKYSICTMSCMRDLRRCDENHREPIPGPFWFVSFSFLVSVP